MNDFYCQPPVHNPSYNSSPIPCSRVNTISTGHEDAANKGMVDDQSNDGYTDIAYSGRDYHRYVANNASQSHVYQAPTLGRQQHPPQQQHPPYHQQQYRSQQQQQQQQQQQHSLKHQQQHSQKHQQQQQPFQQNVSANFYSKLNQLSRYNSPADHVYETPCSPISPTSELTSCGYLGSHSNPDPSRLPISVHAAHSKGRNQNLDRQNCDLKNRIQDGRPTSALELSTTNNTNNTNNTTNNNTIISGATNQRVDWKAMYCNLFTEPTSKGKLMFMIMFVCVYECVLQRVCMYDVHTHTPTMYMYIYIYDFVCKYASMREYNRGYTTYLCEVE